MMEISEDILEDLVEELPPGDDALRKLGTALGFKNPKVSQYLATNRVDGQVGSKGTWNMLFDWKRRTPKVEQVAKLKEALEKADCAELVEKYCQNPSSKEECTPDASSNTSQGSTGCLLKGQLTRSTHHVPTIPADSRIEPDCDGLYRDSIQSAQLTDEMQNSKKVYNLFGPNKGLAVVINNFEKTALHSRKGSSTDVKNIEGLMKSLGYQTRVMRDLNSEEMMLAIKALVSKVNCESHPSVMLVIMSHGDEEGVLGVDGVPVHLRAIRRQMSCMKSMIGKPKILIYQACRGVLKQEGSDTEMSPDAAVEKGHLETDGPVLNISDIYEAHSTAEGYYAYRDTVAGSPFIKLLCEEFIENAHKCDLDTMMNNISAKVAKVSHQTPSVMKQGIRKKIYFHPGSNPL